MDDFTGACVSISAFIRKLSHDVGLRKPPWVMFDVKDWIKFKTTALSSPTFISNFMPNITAPTITKFDVEGVNFVLRKRPEPEKLMLQTGQTLEFNADVGLIKEVIFSDGTRWSAIDGWK